MPKADIAANGYDPSINRYREVVHAQVQQRAPSDILAELGKLEGEIAAGMKTLEGLLGVTLSKRLQSTPPGLARVDGWDELASSGTEL